MIQSASLVPGTAARSGPACAHGGISGLLALAALAGMCLLLAALPARAQRSLSIDDAIALAESYSPSLAASRAREEVAVGGIVTARQFPNPGFEVGAGPQRPRNGFDTAEGPTRNFGLNQPIEYPSVRESRRRTAEATLDFAQAGTDVFRAQLLAQVKANFYEVLQRQEQLQVAEEDYALLTQIRDRIGLRADLGESPRLDLVRTETELLNAQRIRDSAVVRVTQAKLALGNLIGISPDESFTVRGALTGTVQLPTLDTLRARIVRENPQIKQALADQERARNRLELERDLRIPAPTLQAGYVQEPDKEVTRFGIALPLPLFHQRQGQIAEALAEVKVADTQLRTREAALNRELNAAYNSYLVARQQVDIFEKGLLERADRALKAAEAAYRFGERGIIEYLDAQRIFRAVRQDYLNARYELQFALIEIERVLGQPIAGEDR